MSRNWPGKETEKGGGRVFPAAEKAGPKPEVREVMAKSKDERHYFAQATEFGGRVYLRNKKNFLILKCNWLKVSTWYD